MLNFRFFSVLLALVGLVFTIIGVVLVSTADWKTAQATVVGQCDYQTTGTGSNRQRQQVCTMSWEDGGVTHTSRVTFTRSQPIYSGSTATLQVHGNSAAEPTPTWLRFVVLILGLVMLVSGVITFARSGRSRRPSNGGFELNSPIQPG